MPVESFRIHVDDKVLSDLERRLRRTRWSALGEGWRFGTDRAYLESLVAYWLDHYDWRQQEALLNQLPQFVADVRDTRLHFVHQRGDSRALLLLHGWPDSFHRYHKVLPILGGAFDIVVPSLPGFGFTGPVRFGSQPMRHSADLLWRLMTDVLGYRRFVVAGGDTGSVIAQIMAIDHPESVTAIHVTDLGWPATMVDHAAVTKPERKYLEGLGKRIMKDSAYAMVQMTRPHSLAPGLADSPAGLAAWILDRFHSWCDHGDLDAAFTRDDLLTNIMIYWVTQTIGSSIETYRAEAVSPSLTANDRVGVPVGLSLFPADASGVPPRALAERTLNIQRYAVMSRGGHFAALEEPELYAAELENFFTTLTTRASERERPRDVRPTV